MPNLVRPLPDETAGSLLYRFATAHCQTVATVGENLLGLSYQQARSDLDRIVPSRHMETLQRVIGVSPTSVRKLSLPTSWSISVWDGAARQYNGPIRLCNLCLKHGRYGRRYWRTQFAAACPDHGVELIDACPHCAARIPYFSTDSGIIVQHWLESWPHCQACFRSIHTENLANPVLVAMSHRWRNALAGRSQLGFPAEAFLKVSARAINNFQKIAPYQHAAKLVAPCSRWSGYIAAALMIRSICRRRVPLNVCYAAVGTTFCPVQLATDLVS